VGYGQSNLADSFVFHVGCCVESNVSERPERTELREWRSAGLGEEDGEGPKTVIVMSRWLGTELRLERVAVRSGWAWRGCGRDRKGTVGS
jgi:hypothetical protein